LLQQHAARLAWLFFDTNLFDSADDEDRLTSASRVPANEPRRRNNTRIPEQTYERSVPWLVLVTAATSALSPTFSASLALAAAALTLAATARTLATTALPLAAAAVARHSLQPRALRARPSRPNVD
jgi:hypothetical protein